MSDYTRKETVQGYLLPQKGVLKTYSPGSGTIEFINVEVGEQISKGQTLATLVSRKGTSGGVQLSVLVIEQYKQQLKGIEAELNSNAVIYQYKVIQTKKSLDDIKQRIENYAKLKKTVQKKLALQLKKMEKTNSLFENGYISPTELQVEEVQVLNYEYELYTAEANLLNLGSDKNKLLFEQSILSSQHELVLSDIGFQASDIRRKIREVESSYRHILEAPDAGTISSISAVEGEYITENRALITIIPKNTEMVAELLIPTRSSGFIKVGQSVNLRFEAFPYQRFGGVEGYISTIDKSLIINGEIPLPLELNEPVYRVRVKLLDQMVSAYGEEFPLRSGMLLEANIVLDKRSLFEWITDPIASIKGNLS